jgi:hypothetical protein
MALSDIQSIVDDLLRDDAGRITPTQRDTAIVTAVARYSKDRPRQKVEDIVAPGGNLLPLPTAWEADFSQVQSLEYPIGHVPPAIISAQDYQLYTSPGTVSIMVRDGFAINENVRAAFTITHEVSDVADTIPLGDREAVCCLAAASLCDQLAGLYSGDSDSTIQADSVNHQSKAGEFASRARALRKRYLDELGIDAKKNVAAGVVVDLNLSNSLGGARLTHRRGYR